MLHIAVREPSHFLTVFFPVVLITVVGSAGLLIKRYLFPDKKKNSTTAFVATQPSPEAIMEALKKLPPYQRTQAEKSYIGLVVSWKVIFASAVPNGPSSTYAIFQSEANRFLIIGCHVDTDNYPQLKTTRRGVKMGIKGTIDAVEQGTIRLKALDIVTLS